MNSDTVERRCTLPYSIEYVITQKLHCKYCRLLITQSSIRMSKRERSKFLDRYQDNWFHFNCFWTQIKPGNDKIDENLIRGVDWLKWEDQELLRNKIEAFNNPQTLTKHAEDFQLHLKNIKIERSASNRGKCSICKTFFSLGEIKLNYKSKFSHSSCIFKKYSVIIGALAEIIGWKAIPIPEQNQIEKDFVECQKKENSDSLNDDSVIVIETPSPTSNSPNTKNLKRVSIEIVETLESDDNETKKRQKMCPGDEAKARKLEKLKKQANLIWELRNIFKEMTSTERKYLLKTNGLEVPSEEENIMEKLCDTALFGVPAPCPKCSNGFIFYTTSFKTYICSGYETEYSKCLYESKNPIRTPFRLDSKIVEKYKINLAPFNQLVDRLYPDEDDSTISQSESSTFKYFGENQLNSSQPIIDEAFVDENRKNLKSYVEPTIKRQIIKNGTVVDPDFDLAEYCHVHKTSEGGLFSTALTFIDVSCNKNSYYKIQLLRHDSKTEFYLFCSWGRTGTAVGGHKTENFFDEEIAIEEFEKIFLEKTNNPWKYRKFFKKFPGFYNYIETDYSEFAHFEEEFKPGSKTVLPREVKEIIMSIFNVENMKLEMKSFELDTNKLPLGKLSKNQIMSAYLVLTDLQDVLIQFPIDEAKLLHLTNKFYTIIPHNFGMKKPETIKSFKQIKDETKKLDMIMDIQLAFDQANSKADKLMKMFDPVDLHYEQLHCEMKPLDRSSEEFKYITEYMKNTQGSTHVMIYDLLDIIKLSKTGEDDKFLTNIGNRRLLWHGSGRMNYAGILGKGLRIAPPEAPASGYMFGKGVYFADMFTKSFFYCRATNGQEAYILLCEVALGKMKELFSASAESLQTLNREGFNSVKGVGIEYPIPTQDLVLPCGMIVPKGKVMKSLNTKKVLNYNEYIVYDTNQIKLRYLIRVRVKEALRLS